MKIEMRNIDAVKPYERNPRVNDAAVDAVARSIQEFGFRQPIVVDPDGVIVCGHTRYKAALKLGLKEVPVHVATDLTPEQIRAYRIADNKVAELATWDMELLPIELSDLRGMDVDLDLLGFSSEELEKMLGAGIHGNEGLTDPDAVPEPPDDPVTQPGDLWVLGDHRLLCGDSGSPEDLDRLLDGAPIHLVNTDPPYNVKVEPRSNNAIAAGLSSFGSADAVAASDARGMHHQGFDLARDKSKAAPTHRKMRAKDRPLENDFVSDEEFGRAMAGDAIEHATTALLEELVDFFPQARRRLLAKALAKLKKLEARALEVAEKKLDSPELEARMEAALAETGDLSGSSPESSGSTQVH